MIFLTIEWLQLLQEYRGVLVPAPRARRNPPDIEEIRRNPYLMTESELRAELSYSSRLPRCCEFDAAWRALGPAFIHDAGANTERIPRAASTIDN